MGQVIQLQGDQRTKIMGMLIEEGISESSSYSSDWGLC
jgi:translation initiation factor 1 (eIF-1/SUI1)